MTEEVSFLKCTQHIHTITEYTWEYYLLDKTQIVPDTGLHPA